MRTPRTNMPLLPAGAAAALMLSWPLLAGCGTDDEAATTATLSTGTSITVPSTASSTTASSTSDASPTSSPGSSPDTEAGGVAGDEQATAIDVVDRYIEAVAAGDLAGAWDLLDPRSQAALGSFESFDGLASALAEGIGAWSGAQDRMTFVHDVGVADGATAWSVTLLGTVAQEGPPDLAAAAMMVYTDGSTATVSPFEDPFGEAGFLFFEPAEGSELAADRGVVFGLPVGVDPEAVLVDDRPVTPEALSATDVDGETRNFAIVEPGWSTGDHAVTVVATADGARMAVAAAYRVTGEGGD